jgi:anti-anti-sigma factor
LRFTRHDLREGVVRLAVEGDLDLSCAPEFESQLADALAAAAYVVIDLEDVGFVDPGGAAALRAAGRAVGSRLIAVNAQPHVRKTLTSIGVDRMLKLVPTGTPA